MKRGLLWIGVMVVIGALQGLVYEPHVLRQPHDVLSVLLAVASVIWLLVGVAWGARGVVRYLKR